MSSPVADESATGTSGAGASDMKLEVVTIPVSDVDRAKDFYAGLGWRLDADFTNGDSGTPCGPTWRDGSRIGASATVA